MFRAYPIGRLCGIRLDVHASWFPIYALIAATIANAEPVRGARMDRRLCRRRRCRARALRERGGPRTRARTDRSPVGVQTSSISLFLFGGVATLEAEPPGPLADALVALAVRRLSAADRARGLRGDARVDRSSLCAMPTARRGSCLRDVRQCRPCHVQPDPAYPMDGGRVLRALLWRLRGDRDRRDRDGGARRHRLRAELCWPRAWVAGGRDADGSLPVRRRRRISRAHQLGAVARLAAPPVL